MPASQNPIAGNWTGLWADGIDAVVVPDQRQAYFFRGAEYLRYDLDADRADDGYPRPIEGNWPGLSGPVDAAIAWNSGNFGSGSTLPPLRPDERRGRRGLPEGPSPTAGPGFSPVASRRRCGGRRAGLLFRRQYVRFDPAAGAADAGYPLPIAGAWSGLPFGSAGSGAGTGSGAGSGSAGRWCCGTTSRSSANLWRVGFRTCTRTSWAGHRGRRQPHRHPGGGRRAPLRPDRTPGLRRPMTRSSPSGRGIKSDPSLAAAGHTAARKIATLVL